MDARRLSKANYCTSAEQKLGRASELITEYGNQGEEEVRKAFEKEAANLKGLEVEVGNKQKENLCR